MCGIIYAKNLKDNTPVNEVIKTMYITQKHRGFEGFGFVGLNKEEIQTFKAEEEKGILNYLGSKYYDEIMYHHRFPTSTANTVKTAHPFEIKMNGKTYYFIHNGVISNAFDLQKLQKYPKYSSLDKKKGTFNDSEALAYDFILTLTGQQKKGLAKGSCSFLCLQIDDETGCAEQLYYYTNGDSPLAMYKDKDLLILSSETGDVDVEENILFYYDYKTQGLKTSTVEYIVKSTVYETYGGYHSTALSKTAYKGNAYGYGDDFDDDDDLYEYLDEKTQEQVDKLQLEVDSLETAYSQALIDGEIAGLEVLGDMIDEKNEEIDDIINGYICK